MTGRSKPTVPSRLSQLTESHRVAPGTRVRLRRVDPAADGGLDREEAGREFTRLVERLSALQELMYAEGRHGLLVVLQAMDTAGKDSTLRAVFGPLNAQGCSVANFKAPGTLERSHDYLWRVHLQVPPRGYMRIFNRSHYEDVLIVRVRELVPRKQWQPRYEHINHFEQMLHDERIRVVKFFLHISKEYQRDRLQRRLDDPTKWWKFNPEDLEERKLWDDYMRAYEEALSRCSTDQAPWYVIPAERRWYRNLIITAVLVNLLETLDMQYPRLTFDPHTVQIPE